MLIETFGKILSDYRKKAGLSQEKLAELADYDRTYISLMERGLRQPTLTTIFRLSKALGLSPSDMIRDIEKEID